MASDRGAVVVTCGNGLRIFIHLFIKNSRAALKFHYPPVGYFSSLTAPFETKSFLPCKKEKKRKRREEETGGRKFTDSRISSETDVAL